MEEVWTCAPVLVVAVTIVLLMRVRWSTLPVHAHTAQFGRHCDELQNDVVAMRVCLMFMFCFVNVLHSAVCRV